MAARTAAFKAVVDALKARGKTTTVVESTAGGLISSSIMAVEGSSAVYQGGSVAYNTRKCKPVLLNDADLHASLLNASAADADSYKASKRDWTAKTAVAYCEAMGTDYAVAEGGAAGPTFRPKGLDSGFSAIAVAARSPDGIKVVRQALCESPHARRGDNMERFATAAARELLAAATGDGLDRCAGDRDDAAKIASYAARPDATYVVCDGGKALFEADGKLERLARADAERFGDVATATFLGTLDGAPLFAVDATLETDDARFRDTRVHGPFLSFSENQVALAATALVTWKRRSGFCSICGGPCTLGSAGHARTCEKCGTVSFPRSDPAMICAVSNRANDKILLARSPRHPEGVMTTLAGFVEAGETFEACVAREVLEETGVRIDEGSVRYLKSQPWPFPQSCMVAFRCTADSDQELVLDDELLEARWWDRSAVRRACGVPGAVMSPDVAKEAFATDPSLELLVPPKKVVARELIEAWLSET
jgi:NAD+ diphosphatase